MHAPTLEEQVCQLASYLAASSAMEWDIARIRLAADELGGAAAGGSPEIIEAVDTLVNLLQGEGASQGLEPLADDIESLLREIKALLDAVSVLDGSIIKGFLDDRVESLDELEDLAIDLEKGGSEQGLEAIQRIVHSIKGDAGVLGLDDLSRTCHELEDEIERADLEGAASATLKATTRIRQRFSELASGEPWALEGTLQGDDDSELPQPDSMAEVDHEMASEFVTEAREHLESVDANLLVMASDDSAEHQEAVNAVFRAFHTIKGLASFLNLNVVMSLAHEAESALSKVRSEEVQLTKPIVDMSFEVCDTLKGLVLSVEKSLASGEPIYPPSHFAALIARLTDAVAPGSSPKQRFRPQAKSQPAPLSVAPMGATEATGQQAATSIIPGTIKVDASRLDCLVDSIGELVIAEAMVSKCDEMCLDEAVRLPSLLGQLDKTTRELQELAMSLRMVPIRSTFRRMARLARDVSHKLGKKIDFVTQGDDTEMDKTVVDVIGDPLVHMVRNAIDHGLENNPADREQNGKPPVGRIELRAFHEGGCIHVELEDDGKGLDRDAILARACAKGIVGEDAAGMSDSEVYRLIFAPGFSTAETVTEVSGRGVGLDVVRRNIEGLRGRVDIQSSPGRGSVFTIRLPLTLAIIDGMVVRVSRRRYILPTLSIIRMFRPKPGDVSTVLESGSLLRVGDELVPLYRLDDMFALKRSGAKAEEMSAVVVESAAGSFAFLVDELLGQHQIVIKPLGESLGGVEGIAGGAIMSDGTVGLILDIAGLVAIASSSTQRLELVNPGT